MLALETFGWWLWLGSAPLLLIWENLWKSARLVVLRDGGDGGDV